MKRIISLLVAVLFLFTMLPVGALASETVSVTGVKDSIGDPLATDGTAKIDTVEGVLTLVVDDANEVELDGITISDYDGAVVATKTSNTEIEVKFGRLTEGEHTLTVGDNDFTFIAEKETLTSTDFSEYPQYDSTNGQAALDDYLADDNLVVMAGGYSNTNAKSAIITKEGTYKYAQIGVRPSYAGDSAVTGQHGLLVAADNDVVANRNFNDKKNINEDKVYVLDAGMYSNTLQSSFGTLLNDTDTLDTTSIVVNCGSDYKCTKNTTPDGQTIGYLDRLLHPRMVLTREDSSLRQHVYSGDGSGSYTYVAKGNYVCAEDSKVSRLTALSYYYTTTASTKSLYVSYVRCYPERLLSILDVEVSTDESNTVVLHMSDDVLETVSGAVAVTGLEGGEISDFTQAIDNSNRTITLTFANGLAADTYTVDISALYGSNQLKAYTGTKTFALANAWEEAKLAAPVVTDYFGSELEENGVIRTIDGELTLTFEEAINENTLGGITVENAGKVVKELSEDGKVVTLKFGRLAEDKDYTLKAQGVRTAEGRGVRNLELDFTAYRAYLTDTDFTGWTDANLADNLAAQNLSSLNGWGSNDGAGFAKVITDDGNNYISVSPSYNTGTANKAYGLVVNANQDMDSNFNTTETVSGNHVFVIESAVALTYSGGTTSTFGAPNTATGSSAINGTGNSIVGASNEYQAVNMEFSDEVVLNASTGTAYRYTGVDGWRAPRMVLRRDTEDGDLLQDAYDMNNGGMLVGTVKNYNETGTSTTKHILSSTQTIAKFGLLTEYLSSAKLSYEFKYNYVKAYPDMLAGVLEADYIEKDAIFYFSDDIDETTLGSIVIKDGDTVLEGNGIDYEVEYNASNRKLVISFSEDMKSYTVDMSKVKATSGLRMYSEDAVQVCKATVVSNVAFKNENGTKIENEEELAAATKVSVTATITDAPEGVVAFLAVYGEDAYGNSILLAVKEATIEDNTISGETDTFAAGATRAQLFVWKSLESLTPLIKTAVGQCL